MNPQKPIPNLSQLSTSLMANHANQPEVEQIINEIHQHFADLTSISGYDQEIKHLAAVPTSKGMALSLNHAAQCLLDYKRTVQFLRGTVAAIKDKQQQYPNQCIHIFYAGCGPYAPFVTLVAPLFEPEAVQFSLLEINQESLETARKLIVSLGLAPYIQHYYNADATTFKIPAPETYHILFSETLDALLYRESYVPILWNMLPQLSENTTLIPENVVIQLNASTNASDTTNEGISNVEQYAGCIFDVRQTLLAYKEVDSLPIQFPSFKFKLTKKPAISHLIIDTEVYIYGAFKLTRGASSLTLPFNMELPNPLTQENIIFNYHLTPQVELKCQFE